MKYLKIMSVTSKEQLNSVYCSCPSFPEISYTIYILVHFLFTYGLISLSLLRSHHFSMIEVGDRKTVTVSLPYVKGVSERIQKIFL